MPDARMNAMRLAESIASIQPEAGAGEDDDAGAKVLAKWLRVEWDGLSDRDISDQYPDWGVSGIGTVSLQGGKPAVRKIVRAILATAAPAPSGMGKAMEILEEIVSSAPDEEPVDPDTSNPDDARDYGRALCHWWIALSIAEALSFLKAEGTGS